MTSYLNTINSKSGSILSLNNENAQIVSIGNGLIVSGKTTFSDSLAVSQRIGQEGYIYNSSTAGTLDTQADLRVINKRLQPSKETILQKLQNYSTITIPGTITSLVWSEYHQTFLACGTGASPYISTNGITWTNPVSFTRTVTSPVACWSPELQIFVVADSTTQPFHINSVDPFVSSWVIKPDIPLTTVNPITSMCWSPELGIFLASGGNYFFTSVDADIWTETTVAFTFSSKVNSTFWCSELSIFIASASDGSFIYYSTDGTTWSGSSNAFYANSVIEWSPKLYSFVACGSTNNYSTSVDGITWVSRGTNLENSTFIKWINELEFFIGHNTTNGFIYSHDSINWYLYSGVLDVINGICWSKEKSLLLGYADNIILSEPLLPDVSSSLLINDEFITFDYLSGVLYLTKSSGNTLNIWSTFASTSVIGDNSIYTAGGIGVGGISYFSSTTASTSSTSGSIRLDGGLAINNSTDAISTTNGGSITTAGGVAIAKKLFVGTDLTIGTSSTGTLTLPNTTLSGAVLNILNGTDSTSSTTGALTIAGGLGINDSTDAISATNGGSITTAGGVAIAKKLFVGTDATIGTSTTGTLTLPNTTLSGAVLNIANGTDSTSSTTGALTIAGGLGINDSTDAISATNGGSITTAGGVAIAKKLFVGTDATIGTSTTGTLTLPNTTLSGTVLNILNGTDSTSSTTGALTITGGLGINDVTDAISATNGGSITTAGGVAISKKLFVGTDVTVGTSATGTLTLPNTTLSGAVLNILNGTDSTSSTTGALTIAGGLGINDSTDATSITNGGSITTAGGVAIAKKLFVGGSMGVTGQLASLASIAGIYTGLDTNNSRIELVAGNTTSFCYIDFTSINVDSDGRIIYNLNTDTFDFLTNTSIRLSISNTNINITPTTASTSSTTGALTVAGGAGIAGITYIGGGQINLTNGTSNKMYFNINGLSAPANGIYGPAGQKIILYPGTVSAPPFGFGINTDTLWYNAASNATHRWYTGNVEIMTLSSTSLLSLVNAVVENATPSITIRTSGNTDGAVYFGNSAHGVGRPPGTNNVTLYTTSGQVLLNVNAVDRVTLSTTNMNITYTTASTSSTTGALTVAGGAGIAGNINSTGLINQSNSGTAGLITYNSLIPSLADASANSLVIGKTNTNNNSAVLRFLSSSTTPYLGLGLWGADDRLRVGSNYVDLFSSYLRITGGLVPEGIINAVINQGLYMSWNETSGEGEAVITYTTGTGGTPRLIIRTVNHTTGVKTDRATWASNGDLTQNAKFNVAGSEINLTNGTSNKIYFNLNGLSGPANGIYGPAGQKIILYPGTGVNPPYGFGIANNELWYNTGADSGFHKWYTGNNARMTLSNTSLALSQTTASTSSTTGALTVAGGAGILGNLYVGGNLFGLPQVAIIQEQLANGTASNYTTTGSYVTRVLNTVVSNTITSLSLSSNQITFPAGTYRVDVISPGYDCASTRTRLRNITDSTTIIFGNNAYAGTGSAMSFSHINTVFTIAATKVIELQQYFGGNASNQTGGVAASTGDPEVYARIVITKLL